MSKNGRRGRVLNFRSLTLMQCDVRSNRATVKIRLIIDSSDRRVDTMPEHLHLWSIEFISVRKTFIPQISFQIHSS